MHFLHTNDQLLFFFRKRVQRNAKTHKEATHSKCQWRLPSNLVFVQLTAHKTSKRPFRPWVLGVRPLCVSHHIGSSKESSPFPAQQKHQCGVHTELNTVTEGQTVNYDQIYARRTPERHPRQWSPQDARNGSQRPPQENTGLLRVRSRKTNLRKDRFGNATESWVPTTTSTAQPLRRNGRRAGAWGCHRDVGLQARFDQVFVVWSWALCESLPTLDVKSGFDCNASA